MGLVNNYSESSNGLWSDFACANFLRFHIFSTFLDYCYTVNGVYPPAKRMANIFEMLLSIFVAVVSET